MQIGAANATSARWCDIDEFKFERMWIREMPNRLSAMSAAWPHAVGTIRSKLVFLIDVRPGELFAERKFIERSPGLLPSGMGIDDESDQVT
jgi:hypothetical protein